MAFQLSQKEIFQPDFPAFPDQRKSAGHKIRMHRPIDHRAVHPCRLVVVGPFSSGSAPA